MTLEGGEGAGKSTQARALAAWLEAKNILVRLTREPGGSPGAEEIRQLLTTGAPGRWGAVTEALLLSAARRDHVDQVIGPSLTAGTWVVSDRFTDSTLAYQGYGHGLDLGALRRLQTFVVDGLRPDLTLLFDLPVEIGLARSRQRLGDRVGVEDRYERLDSIFHNRIRHGFLDLAAGDPERFAVIDATAPIDQVGEVVRQVVTDRLLDRTA